MDKIQKKIDGFYNKVLPQHKLKALSLEPIDGILGETKARHILSRCLFGFTPDNINQIKQLTIDQALNLLFEPSEITNPPLSIDSRDEDTIPGETWVNNPFNNTANTYRLYSLHAWWIGQMLNQPVSLQEKMVLFWHNHFVTETNVVNRAGLLYQYNDCLRKNALGNFQKLTEEITVLPAMLKYLDGDDNPATAPNENYARELLELFTIGKGPQIDEGDYTNYTEADVREAARVLTGWKINYDNRTAVFQAAKHDSGSKTFSSAFGNAQLSNGGQNEYKNLIQLIFEQEETARFLARKLYRWFVYYVIDEEIETTIIEPLALEFKTNNYEIKPVLLMLLSSQHFFDEDLYGCIIKNPLDLLIGTLKHVSFPIPGFEYLLDQYDLWNLFFQQAGNLEMKLGTPPDVAGWPAYYQAPMFHQLWVNASTIPQKASLTDGLVSNQGITRNGHTYIADLIEVAKSTTKPQDVNVLINELSFRFFPQPLAEVQKAQLKAVLISGLPDSEWASEWQQYQSNPNDENQRVAIESKLRSLFETMFRMAEYQLS